MPQFDVAGARKEGYSDAEIISHLTSSRKFDVSGARKEGYKDSEIIDYLSKKPLATPSSGSRGDPPVKPAPVASGGRGSNARAVAPTRPPDSTLYEDVLGTANRGVEMLQAPVRKFQERLEHESQSTVGRASPSDRASYVIEETVNEGMRKVAGLVGSMFLDPTNIPFVLASGGASTTVRPALRLGADALFAVMSEAGAIDALRKGDYTGAMAQQAFALLGLAGMGKVHQEQIFREAQRRTEARTAKAVEADKNFYADLAKRSKEKQSVAPAPKPKTVEPVVEPVKEAEVFAELQVVAKTKEPPVETEPVVSEPIAAKPETTTPIEEPIVAPAETPAVAEPAKTGPTFFEAKEALRGHPVRPTEVFEGPEYARPQFEKRLGDAAVKATNEQRVDYLVKLRTLAKTYAPEALAAVEKAEAALLTGNKRKFGVLAQDAKDAISTVYQKAAAKEQAAKHGIELPEETVAPTREQLIEDSVESRMQAWRQEIESGDTSLTGKVQRLDPQTEQLRNYEDPSDPGAGVRRFGGGYKDGTPLEHFPEPPGVLAKAILNGKGALFERIKKAFREAVETEDGPAIDEFFELSKKKEKPVEAEPPTPEMDVDAFDFGANVIHSVDKFVDQQKAAIKDLMKQAGTGETAGAGLPVEVTLRLAAIGAAKMVKGTVKFVKWSTEMIADLGEEIRPHLQEIYSKSLERMTALKEFKPEEYFKFRRTTTLSLDEKQGLIDGVTRQILETGKIPKEKQPWAKVVDDAKELYGQEIVPFLKQVKESGEQYRAARVAMRQRMQELNREVVETQAQINELRKTDPDAADAMEATLTRKEADLGELIDLHMSGGLRSEEGRNLALNRLQSDSTWSLEHWLARTKKALGLPAEAHIPEKVRKEVQEIIVEGEVAQKELENAELVETLWGTQREIPTSALPVKGPFAPPKATPPVPSTPVTTTWGIQQGIPAAPRPPAITQPPVATPPGATVPPASLPPVTTIGVPGTPPPPAVRARVTAARTRVQQARARLGKQQAALKVSTPREVFSAVFKAGLMGPLSHLRNVGGSGGQQIALELRRVAPMFIDLALRPLFPRQVQGPSPRAVGRSIGYAMTEGLKQASDVLRNGLSVDELNRMNLNRELNARAPNWPTVDRGLQVLNKVVNTQFRFLSAEDRIFKSYAFRRALEEMLWLKAKNQGSPKLSRLDVDRLIAATKANLAPSTAAPLFGQGATSGPLKGTTPSRYSGTNLDVPGQWNESLPIWLQPDDALIANAIAYSEYATFNNQNAVAATVQSGLQQGLASKNRARKAGTAMLDVGLSTQVPFMNTPANIFVRQFDTHVFSPLRAMAAPGRVALNALMGRALRTGQERRVFELAIGDASVGVALMYLGSQLYKQGMATGTYDPREGSRNVQEAANEPVGGFLVGGRWIGIGQLAPWGTTIAMGAALARESDRPLSNELRRPMNVAEVGTRGALDQPMLAGLSRTIRALQQPGTVGLRAVSATSGAIVPTIISDVAGAFDPFMRDARPETFTEALYKGAQARVPGLRNMLSERYDVLGDPRPNTYAGSEALELTDPVRRELVSNRVSIGSVDPDSYKLRGVKEEQQESMAETSIRGRLVGKLINEDVGRVLSIDRFSELSAERRTELLNGAVQAARERAQNIIKGAVDDGERRKRYETPEARTKFLLDQIERVDLRLAKRPAIPKIQPAPQPVGR